MTKKYQQAYYQCLYLIIIRKYKKGFNIILGKVNGDRITGSLYAWTDLTIDRDAKDNIIMVQEKVKELILKAPLKAQIVNVDLSPNN